MACLRMQAVNRYVLFSAVDMHMAMVIGLTDHPLSSSYPHTRRRQDVSQLQVLSLHETRWRDFEAAR